jgi:ElaB/YqjD/DUF883 family membrane-anchored ribosome-binding protein
MVYENEQIGGGNGSEARSRGERAQEWARSRGTQASEWARSQVSRFQGRVESNPEVALYWALGAGVVVGLVLGTLMRGSRQSGLWREPQRWRATQSEGETW